MSSSSRHETFGPVSHHSHALLTSQRRNPDAPSDLHHDPNIFGPSEYSITEKSEIHPAVPAIVAIGVSTGGPTALEQILPLFPSDFPIPILIVQHMPSGFTAPFAERLNMICSITVREATQQQTLQPAVAYIAPAGSHMRVVHSITRGEPILLLDFHRGNALHMPSIDLLMKSVAEVYRNRAIGVIMTGMGHDGANGIAAIYKEGGLTIGQNEATCAVYSMPRACAEAGVLTKITSLARIPAEIIRAAYNSRRE